MADLYYPTENISLPTDKSAIRNMQLISLTFASLVLCVALLLLLDLVFKLSILSQVIGRELVNFPFIIAIILSSLVIFFLTAKKHPKKILIAIATMEMLLGLSTAFVYFFPEYENLRPLSIGSFELGLWFFSLGLSLLISCANILHRFHYAQTLLFALLSISFFRLLESLYQIILLATYVPDVLHTFFTTLLLFTICLGILLSKPNRGFIGIFTTDSVSGQLARLSLLYFITLPPFVGLLILVLQTLGYLDIFGSFALMAVSFMLMVIIITWVNVKFLHNAEVKHYVMKEGLRINNVTLELNTSDLATKVTDLKKSNNELLDKFKYGQSLKDIMGNLD